MENPWCLKITENQFDKLQLSLSGNIQKWFGSFADMAREEGTNKRVLNATKLLETKWSRISQQKKDNIKAKFMTQFGIDLVQYYQNNRIKKEDITLLMDNL